MKQLGTPPRDHGVVRRVASSRPEPRLAPGMVIPPPAYVLPPPPYERLVYGGPRSGVYGGWGGYRGRYPGYP